MPVRNIGLLPEQFRTNANEKFLNATVEQLTSESDLKKVNGYIGRSFTNLKDVDDNYIAEITSDRENYQLEPSVVINDNDGNATFVSHHIDLLNKIRYYGGNSDNQSRLFDNEYYTYNSQIDYDKFVNFSQYYWLPAGPGSVDIFSSAIPVTDDIDVIRTGSSRTVSADAGNYAFSNIGNQPNPMLILARGGSYTFNIDQDNPFFIQTEPGTSGHQSFQPNFSTREVHGVTNNGETNGTLKFNVPDSDAQDFYTNMTNGPTVNLAVQGIAYDEMQGKYLNQFLAGNNGLDGNYDLANKLFIFVDNNSNDNDWIATAPYDNNLGFGTEFADGEMVPQQHRTGIWQVNLEYDALRDDHIIHLTAEANLVTNTTVSILEGTQFNGRTFYIDNAGATQLVPLITALQDTLYYQDGNDSGLVGVIRLVEEKQSFIIDVDATIIGQETYTSPNGVVFTNGLKVMFDSSVIPAHYANNEYYIEGVGNGITLTAIDILPTPESFVANELEPYDSTPFSSSGFEGGFDSPSVKDYITINRSSIDGNAWSRGNRWFHIDVIQQSAKYENFELIIDQAARANRPIIEFNAHLQLFESGSIAVPPIDTVDLVETDALSNIHGALSPLIVDGITMEPGMRVVFLNDDREAVRTKVYLIKYEDLNNDGFDSIVLQECPEDLATGTNLLVRFGLINQAKMFNFNNGIWSESQAKTKLNQPPLFNMFTQEGTSLSDLNAFPNSSFKGTKLFSYAVGNGQDDTILGFPLKYKNFQTVGDIVFENDFDADVFTYTTNQITLSEKINKGVCHKIIDADNFTQLNVWDTVYENSNQSQLFSFTDTSVNVFVLDIEIIQEKNTIHYRVFVDSVELNRSDFIFSEINGKLNITILSDLTNINQIDVLVLSDISSPNAWYQIPSNLENNAQNAVFDELTLGQIRNHVDTAYHNSTQVDGVFPGESNLRDNQDTLKTGGNILQHSAGLGYANLFLLDERANFVEATLNAQREYTRFKNKFVDLTTKLEFDVTDPVAAVDLIVSHINQVKTPDFPWYASDMLPYGGNTNTIEYEVVQLVDKDYELTTLFNNTVLSNKAVLVYVNGKQLSNKVDFEYNIDRPYITIRDEFNLQFDDIITIVEYENTDGSWIPETPTKLGLYPAFEPAIYEDSAYQADMAVIRGHDGSLTPTFDDFRDAIILELEKRIYNNIKTTYKESRLSINDVKPGKFRNSDYTLDEFNLTLSRMFFKFVGENKLDYRENAFFDSNNGFTYNYRKFGDKIDNSPLNGSWKAIFNYYYDTIHPSSRPWEMLGFSIKPNWWEPTYGPAPYTSGNLVLWDDLEKGIIRGGDRSGTDATYARPGLTDIIPVDRFGEILNPNEFLVNGPSIQYATEAFTVGEEGPVESAWRISSQFPYAMQIIMALLKPAKYFGLFVDVQNYNYNNKLKQYLHDTTNQRLTQLDLTINGEVENNEFIRSASYINWIADYIKGDGVSPTSYLGTMLKDYEVNLTYKVAGFTDKSMLKIIGEQSSPSSTTSSIIIPDEDYQIKLNKSAPIVKINYSGVIILKTDIGFKVDGYNIANPHFTILPSIDNNNTTSLKVLNDTVVVYRNYANRPSSVPYGTEFTSKSALVDFLISYGRWLERQGFIFNEFSSSTQEINNWTLSAKEFLFWSQQGWGENNVLTVNPLGNKVHLNTPGAVAGEIKPASPSVILDRNFNPITPQNFTVKRIDNEFLLETAEAIGFLEISLIQHEHILIFNNITVFKDIIYQAELGNRQIRLKLVGSVSNNWNGNLSPGGFIYNEDNVQEWQQGRDYKRGDIITYKSNRFVASNTIDASITFDYTVWEVSESDNIKTGLLPNYSNLASRAEDFYNIDDVNLENQIDLYGKGLIGYRSREYFNDLGIDDTSQIKFYQGMIREKGTLNSVEALTRAQFGDGDSDINVYEEWALRVGEYGAIDSTQFIEIRLNEFEVTANPSLLVFKDSNDIADRGAINVFPRDIHEGPVNYKKDLFLLEETNRGLDHNIKTAGQPTLDEVDYTLFSFDDYYTLNNYTAEIGIGQSIWVARDVDEDWNVYRVASTPADARDVIIADNIITVNTDTHHKLAVNDRIMLRNINDIIDGWYIIDIINDLNTFTVTSVTDIDDDELTSVGFILRLESTRYKYATAVSGSNLLDIRVNEKTYIDEGDDDLNWAVIQKNNPWNFNTKIIPSTVGEEGRSGHNVDITSDGILAFSGAPYANNGAGEVEVSIKNNLNQYNLLTKLTPPSSITEGFGHSVTTGDIQFIAISAPFSFNNSGQVFIYKFDNKLSNTFELYQIFTVDNLESDHYLGSVVQFSDDNEWLFMSDSDKAAVIAYSLQRSQDEAGMTVSTSTLSPNPLFTLTFTLDNIDRLIINDDTGKHYIPGIDYNLISNDTVKFTTAFDYGTSNTRTINFKKQGTYFKEVAELHINDVNMEEHNYSISTSESGDYVAIGSPSSTSSGEVVVYNRMVERVISDEFQTVFNVTPGFDPSITTISIDDDFIDNTHYILDSANGRVTFNNSLPVNTIVEVNTNTFVELHVFAAPDSTIHTNDLFGFSNSLCSTGCYLGIGMPGYDNDETQTNHGIVYGYTNQASHFGKIISESDNDSILTEGSSIRINNTIVIIDGTTTANVVQSINVTGIPGVEAELVGNGNIQITTDSKLTADKLSVLPGPISPGNTENPGFDELGFTVFIRTHTINSPLDLANEKFGESIAVDSTAGVVAIGSSDASTTIRTLIDNSTTIFDNNSTRFGHIEKDSGAVTIFEYIPAINESIDNLGTFIIGQQLIGEGLSRNDKFGASVALGNDVIIVGSPGDDIGGIRSGSTYAFRNDTKKKIWETIRTQHQRVETTAINKIFTYNDRTQLISGYLDYIDPTKGKILGGASQEITYIVNNDPALYNVSVDSDYSSHDIYWSTAHVGKVWWDLSAMRYIDYEQGDVKYKFQNWGKIFPGSSIDVYEWVLTDVLPSEYIDAGYDGTPKDIDDSLYTAITLVDNITGVNIVRYYYWVKDKITVDVVVSDFRTMTVSQVANMIEFPKEQGIPYAEILNSSSIGLVNVNNLLENDDIILHVDYDVQLNKDVIHSEYTLIQEGGSTNIPNKTINKIIDSLAGVDNLGNTVPDTDLPLSKRYGIAVRPRQSMFIARLAAVEAMVNDVNKSLALHRILDIRSIPSMYKSDPVPTVASNEYDEVVATLEILDLIDVDVTPIGYSVLVEQDLTVANYWVLYTLDVNLTWSITRVQSYDTSRFWTSIDWYAAGYDSTTRIDLTFATSIGLHTLQVPELGTIIKVNDNGNSQWELLEVREAGFEIIAVENSTIKLSSELYIPVFGAGFDSLGFGLGRWDQSPQEETRNIVTSLLTEIFIDDLATIRNKLFFVLARHIFSEHHNIDWLFKTSFISVNHAFNRLEQLPIFKKDNQTYLEDYINEVKPYRTKIREYLVDYKKIETWEGDVTDFDVPGYYDFNLNRFRSPDGSQTEDNEILSEQPQYRQWYNNHAYSVTAISVADGGSGYSDSTPPAIVITGNGSGAKATAQVVGGIIVSITVTASGSGYTSTPTITFDTGAGTAARAYAHLSNDTVRKIKTTIKFDRVAYDTIVKDWAASTNYEAGDIITYNGNAFRATVDFVTNDNATFTGDNLEIVPAEEFDNAMDRTWAFYQPTPGMIGRDLGQLFTGIDYPGIEIVGPQIESGFDTYGFGTGGFGNLPEFALDTITDGGTLITNFNGLRPGEMDIDGGAFVDQYSSHGPEELVPGRVFETIDMQTYTVIGSDYENDGANTKSSVRTHLADGTTSAYAYAEVIELDTDEVTVYIHSTGLQREGVDYNVDYNTKIVTFISPPPIGENIIIYVTDHVGVGLVTNDVIIGDGAEINFRIHIGFSIISDSFVSVDGIVVPSTMSDGGNQTTLVTVIAPPINGARVHIRTYATGISADFSEIKTEFYTIANSGDTIITLTNPVTGNEPLAGNMIIENNGLRLTPPSAIHWATDGGRVLWKTPEMLNGVSPSIVNSADIKVFVDGIENTSWALLPQGGRDITNRTIDITPAPAAGTDLIIEMSTQSDYTIIGNNVLSLNIEPTAGDIIRAVTWSDHSIRKMKTIVLNSANNLSLPYSVILQEGFDVAGFDTVSLDGPIIGAQSSIFTDAGYIWITQGGQRLHPNIDFTINTENSTLSIINPTGDVIIVTTFTEKLLQPKIAHRMFQDISGAVTFLRISEEYSTSISDDIFPDSTFIEVEDIGALAIPNVSLAQPGVIFVNGERITYYGRGATGPTHPHFPNMNADSVWQLARGTQGTSVAPIHLTDDVVVCGSKRQEIPGTQDTRIDTLNQPWVIWNEVVDTDAELLALDPNGYRPGAKALVLHPDNIAHTQTEYRAIAVPVSIQADTNPGIVYPIGTHWWDTINLELNYYNGTVWTVIGTEDIAYTTEWELYKAYIDKIWHTSGDGTATDGLGLQSSDSIQSLFLKDKPSFIPEF